MSENAGYRTKIDTKHHYRYRLRQFLVILAGFFIVLFLAFIVSVISLRWINPSFTSFTLREDWAALEAERYNLRDYWTDPEHLPDHLIWAVIASEDQRFWEHRGLDFAAIEEAIEERRRGERQRGASTITQQVAKNLYLSSAESFLRKGIEAGIALMIEIFWPKERIIEIYLNIAEFGPGMYGIGKAVSDLFEKSPEELIPDESARLAAVLPSPKRMRAEPPSPFAEERSQWILRQMSQLTGISYVQEADTSDLTGDQDPYHFEIELPQAGDTVRVMEDSLFWDDIPDTLLNLDW
jgi:monofunctional glycosyltransferase